jgi:hypothetical protein
VLSAVAHTRRNDANCLSRVHPMGECHLFVQQIQSTAVAAGRIAIDSTNDRQLLLHTSSHAARRMEVQAATNRITV